MANQVVMMQPVHRQEEQTKYTGYADVLYIFRLRSEEYGDAAALEIEFIWCSAPAPNTGTTFDAMSNGSLIFDTDASGLVYYKNAAAAFAEVGDLT